MKTTLCCMPLQSALCSTALISLFPVLSLPCKKSIGTRCLSLALENPQGSTMKDSILDSDSRRLILLRHAESAWNNFSLKDHDRPLSAVGRAAAANVAHKLQQLGWVPKLILCSDATRTKETLSIMQEQVRSFLHAAVHFCPSFYSVAAMDGQTSEHLQEMICKFSSDDIFTVMCMGHNKGWEEAASTFTASVIELKTCNAALLEAKGKSWEEAFTSAGLGGWKLHGIVTPDCSREINDPPT
ncbi:uncharacterized protein At3g52155, chloroplastic isoform X1 [Silene latifolia]|uniref:uncharacterized protein At3g52155, chloroplastic isoform X1 n=1 Tax=Silene latifolia TaxID=37657 RepID=UPI003D783577